MNRAEQSVWEKGSATDSAAAWTQSPQKLCCQVQGSFSPCLSNGEHDTCLGTLPRLLVTVTHSKQTFQAVLLTNLSTDKEKNPYFAPCQVTLFV